MSTHTKPVFLNGKHRTGRVVAHYPAAVVPDRYKDDVNYKLDVIVPADEMDKFEAIFAEAHTHFKEIEGAPASAKKALAAGKAKQADPPWKELEDGSFLVKIKRKAKSAKGRDMAPMIIGRSGKPIKIKAEDFGNGSIVDVGFSAKVYYTPLLGYGVSFSPDVVQVIEPRKGTQASVDQYGFEVDENAEEEEDYGFETEEFTDSTIDPGEDF
jgi:hypothetical protein